MDQAKLNAIIIEAHEAARKEAHEYLEKHFGGNDAGACGFAWVEIWDYEGKRIKGNTKLGKQLKAAGIGQNYRRIFQIWDPAGLPVQSIDTKYAGAIAAAQVFKKHGFDAFAGSRLD